MYMYTVISCLCVWAWENVQFLHGIRETLCCSYLPHTIYIACVRVVHSQWTLSNMDILNISGSSIIWTPFIRCSGVYTCKHKRVSCLQGTVIMCSPCSSLKPVKVDIVNLQVTATVPYQLFPITPTPPSLPHYSSTLQEYRYKIHLGFLFGPTCNASLVTVCMFVIGMLVSYFKRSKFKDADGRIIQAQTSEQLYTAILERLKVS